MVKKSLKLIAGLVLMLSLSACTVHTTMVDNSPGRPTTYVSPASPGPVQGVGIESQDIVSMTDKMVRDIMANPFWVSQSQAPRVIMDSRYFSNESTNPINKKIITDRLRIELNRAASGRMSFVGRHYANMVEHERHLRNQGIVDQGNRAQPAQTLGGDYRLGGRITSRDAVSPTSGTRERFTQIAFEMVDLRNGAIVWGGIYEFRKAATEDVIYR